jgi:ZIP family zinc transporter
MLEKELLYALLGTGFTCGATVLGAGLVFLFRQDLGESARRIFLGFAAGVMVAASVWSLLIPAMEMAAEAGASPALAAGGGFLLGGAFLLALDRLLPHLHPGSGKQEGLPAKLGRTTMVVFAVTLHNIPEGMAVGLSFALAAREGTLPAAMALALGMGLQNFPEGAAVSLPLRSQGASKKKAFVCGALSGVVEPVFGLLTVLAADRVAGLMPWILAFAAGAMIYVVVEELIPEAQLGEHSHLGTVSVMSGFLIMMLLDVMLG